MDDNFDTAVPYRLRRNKDQGSYSREEIYELLDSEALCHLAVVIDNSPVVIPTLYARRGDEILVHGSRASSILRAAQSHALVNLMVTRLDALVLPDAIFEHTIDYACVSVAGFARIIDDEAEKSAALNYLSESVFPGRYAQVREPNDSEARQTTIIAIAIEQATLKFSRTDLAAIDSPSTWTGRIRLGKRPLTLEPSSSWETQRPQGDFEALAAKFR